MSARLVAVLALSLLCTTCTNESDRLRVVIEVDSDLTVPGELDRITLSADGQQRQGEAEADLREHGLPRTIALERAAGPLGPVRVTVEGFLGTRLIERQERVVYFSEAETVHTRVLLTRDCLSVLCESGETCSAGVCIPTPDARPPPDDAGTDTDADTQDDAGDDDAGDDDAGTSDAGDAGRDASGSDAGDAGDGAAVSDAGDAGDGAVASDADASPPLNPGARPTCALGRPIQNDVYQVGTSVSLRAGCNDPETGPLTTLRWTSDRDGQLATGAGATTVFRTTGRHTVTVCAPDPRDATLVGCSAVGITITEAPQPSATITSITQGTNGDPPFMTGQPILLTAAGTGNAFTVSWRDSLQGPIGTGGTVSITSPVAGFHTVTATVRDRDGNEASRSRSFLVIARPDVEPR